MAWSAIVFGWPAVICAVMGFAIAVISGRGGVALAAAMVAAPFWFYASGSPLLFLKVGGLAALAANFGAAWLLYQRHRRAALAMLLPFVIVATRLAYAVIAQPKP